MKKLFVVFFALLIAVGYAEDKKSAKEQGNKTHLLRAFSLANPQVSAKFNADLKLGGQIRAAIIQNKLVLKDASKKKDHGQAKKNIAKLEAEKVTYDGNMQKAYGVIPNLTYISVAEQGTVYLLLSGNELDSIGTANSEKPAGKITEGKVTYNKFPAFKLNSSSAIQGFNNNLRIGTQLKLQQAAIAKELKKGDKSKKADLDKKAALVAKKLGEYNAGMKKTYGIRPNLKYIFESTASSVYVTISDAHLKRVAQMQEAERSVKIQKALAK